MQKQRLFPGPKRQSRANSLPVACLHAAWSTDTNHNQQFGSADTQLFQGRRASRFAQRYQEASRSSAAGRASIRWQILAPKEHLQDQHTPGAWRAARALPGVSMVPCCHRQPRYGIPFVTGSRTVLHTVARILPFPTQAGRPFRNTRATCGVSISKRHISVVPSPSPAWFIQGSVC